jgi:hypothetical protein
MTSDRQYENPVPILRDEKWILCEDLAPEPPWD